MCLGAYTGLRGLKYFVSVILELFFPPLFADVCYVTSFVVKNNVSLEACVELWAKSRRSETKLSHRCVDIPADLPAYLPNSTDHSLMG